MTIFNYNEPGDSSTVPVVGRSNQRHTLRLLTVICALLLVLYGKHKLDRGDIAWRLPRILPDAATVAEILADDSNEPRRNNLLTTLTLDWGYDKYEYAQGMTIVRKLIDLAECTEAKDAPPPPTVFRAIGTALKLVQGSRRSPEVLSLLKERVFPLLRRILHTGSNERNAFAGYLLGTLCEFDREDSMNLLLESLDAEENITYGVFAGLQECKADCRQMLPVFVYYLRGHEVGADLREAAAVMSERCISEQQLRDESLKLALIDAAARGSGRAAHAAALFPPKQLSLPAEANAAVEYISPEILASARKVDFSPRGHTPADAIFENIHGVTIASVIAEVRRRTGTRVVSLAPEGRRMPDLRSTVPWQEALLKGLKESDYTMQTEGSMVRIYDAESFKRRERVGLFATVTAVTSPVRSACSVHGNPRYGCVADLAELVNLEVVGVENLEGYIDLIASDVPWDELLDVLLEKARCKGILDGNVLVIKKES